MDFFSLSTWGYFFQVTAFRLRLSGLGFDGFSFVFRLEVSFFHVTVFGSRPSGLSFVGFFWFFDMRFLFSCYCLWLKAVGFSL